MIKVNIKDNKDSSNDKISFIELKYLNNLVK